MLVIGTEEIHLSNLNGPDPLECHICCHDLLLLTAVVQIVEDFHAQNILKL